MIKSARILILDDDGNLRKTLTDILRIKGLQPVPMETGAEALERVQAEDFAVALIDLRLEDMPGLEVLREIRKRSPDTECLLVTGHASQATAIEAINLGAYSYVQKPFDVDQLYITIRNAVEKQQVGQALKENEARYRGLFEDSPISIWEEDFSAVKVRIENLRREGVSDFQAYLEDHPEVVGELLSYIKVLDVNQASIKLMHAASKEQLISNFEHVTKEAHVAGFRDEFVHIANGETDFTWEGVNYTLDGQSLTVSLHWLAVPGYEETLGKVVVSLIDITERKQAEKALRESEFFFKESQRAANVGSYKADFIAGIWESSEVLDRIFGIDQTYDRSIQGWLDIIHPEDRGIMDRYLTEEVMAKHQPFNREYRIVRKSDGETRWVLGQGQLAFDAEGRTISLTGTIQDVSDRKRAEDALRLSEERFRSVFENVSIGIYRTAPDGRIFLANPALCSMLGYDSFEDLAKQNLEQDDFHPEYSRAQFRELIESQGEVVGLETYWKMKDGSTKYVRESARVVRDERGRVLYYEGTAEDVSERRQAERSLLTTRNLLTSFLENAPMAAYVSAADDRIRLVNHGWELERKLTREKAVGSRLDDLFPAEMAKRLSHDNHQVLETGQPLSLEETVNDPEGEHHYLTVKFPLFDPEGKVEAVGGLSVDITERKRAEAELQRTLSLQRATLDSTADGILVVDQVGKISSYNRRFGEMWGIPQSLLDTQDDEKVMNSVLAQLEEPEKFVGGVKYLYARPEAEGFDVLEFKDGRTFERLSLPQRLGDKIVGRVWSFRDVTARKQAEIKLIDRTEELRRQNEELTRLNEQAERRMQRLVSMRTIDMAISGSFDVGIVLGIVLDQVTGQLGTSAADILLFNPNGQIFKFSSGRGFRTQGLERSQYQFGTDLTWRLIRERHKVEIPDLKAQLNALQRTPNLSGEGFVSYIGLPLMSKGQIQGVLEVFDREPLQRDQEWHNYLDTLAGQAAIAIDNAQLFDHLQNSNTELVMAYDSTLAGWANALELRDKETEGHARRVAGLTTQLAHAMGLSEDEQVQIYRGALLHDIGKMGIPDSIVLKPGTLTEEEWDIMHRHPQYAFDMLAPISYLRPALEISHCHHEKWDGTGYPRKLKGENIPLAARLFAVVDVWDAKSTSDRPYRKAWSEQEAIDYIRQQSGMHFDPAVVKVFLDTSSLLMKVG